MGTGSEKKYGGLDGFRIIAAILVIANHTSPLLSYDAFADFTLTRIVSRVTVPFFFMCTGYFFLQQIGTDKDKNFDRLLKFLYKVGKLYMLSILLYLPINVYAGYFTNQFSVMTMVKDILFNGTLYHLWYFPGVMLGVCICYFLHTRLSAIGAFLIALLLYGIGLLGDSYYAFAQMNPYIESFYQAMFSLFDFTRNGIFFAPVFIMLGGLIATYGKHDQTKRMSYTVGFVFFFAMMVTEGLLVHAFHLSRHDSMYLLSIPCMYFLFQLLLSMRIRSRRYLRNLGMYVYILHPMCIVIIRAMGKATGLTSLVVENSLVHFLLVTVLSFVVSVFAIILVKKIKKESSRAPDYSERAWAEINVAHLQHNVREIRRVLPKGCDIMAVVKAQAYGHGGWQIARYLQKLGIGHFAVATLEEGIELRKKGVRGEILVLGHTHESHIRQIARYRLTQTVVDAEHAKKLNDCKVKIHVHIKIDTGMGRLGESYHNIEEIASLYRYRNLYVCGTFTHLNAADSLEEPDVIYTKNQISRFQKVIEQLRAKGIDPQKLHVQSSYGVFNYSELNYDYARIGIALYGMLSSEGDKVKTHMELRPVLSLKARVVQVKQVEKGASVGYGRAYTADRDGKIAIISIGYADGMPRLLSHASASCLIKGKRVPIIGSVCMDQLIVDISDLDDAVQGDIATLIGVDQAECISAEELASQCSTITNELVSRLGERVKKVYRSDSIVL
ncbi:serine racemase VanT catalytic subunit [Brevibacillus ruminantium]|uniref:Alanine racemase n=1 Tax=Brevibacillus ruminantium TaxID=2950604 RepID=A0ABY4WNZ2_9BACL|nr:serine racemase VanT catalytic subunit [Brevibacillus ruminantium]USG67868.1 serine racemase VanT catalytic subunit [Brevibacillus ruminantium]